MTDADVLVIGGGPAGASSAFQLARAGVRVRVLERARFPRAKPCAECLSPQATRVLNEMGALPDVESRGVWLKGMIVRSPEGVSARGDYAASHGFKAVRDSGLSIRREILDAALLDRARNAGAEVLENTRVTDVTLESGRVSGVRVLDGSGHARNIPGRFIVGADGLRSVIARRLGLNKTATWPKRVALVAHYRDVRDITEYGEMHVERDGFVGIADVGNGLTTVAAVFPQRRARAIAADRDGFLDHWIASKPHLASRFSRASRDGKTTAVGPFASHARRGWHTGALLVGDAADFFDPFTGEGIYAALRGGEIASGAILKVLDTTSAESESQILCEYDQARRREFGGKWTVERLVGIGVATPFIINRAARSLAASKDLADLLVGVTGDFVPAREVLSFRYLTRLLLLSPKISHLGSATAWQ
jgi:geranylgeranyl reductase family protein